MYVSGWFALKTIFLVVNDFLCVCLHFAFCILHNVNMCKCMANVKNKLFNRIFHCFSYFLHCFILSFEFYLPSFTFWAEKLSPSFPPFHKTISLDGPLFSILCTFYITLAHRHNNIQFYKLKFNSALFIILLFCGRLCIPFEQ